MKKILNVLFVTRPDVFLHLENDNVVIRNNDDVLAQLPLLNLEGIICFNYFGATPALMGECAKRNITISFLNENGKYIGTLYGETRGNVVLRKEQYRISDDESRSISYAKNFIIEKLHNQKSVIDRAIRDYPLRVDVQKLLSISSQIRNNIKLVQECSSIESLRAIEGTSAQAYFSVFNDLILQNQTDFIFTNRNRRPPTDPINALLSLAYTILAAECRHALEIVGLDSYVGFMHTDRPGRASLALDLMEELRPQVADRFVLSLINRKEITIDDFEHQESGAVYLKKEAKTKFFTSWQERRLEMLTHPFIDEKIEMGLVPYIQALLLAKAIRNDIDTYPPYLWR
jgi:CRISPR-associated protein Cas1